MKIFLSLKAPHGDDTQRDASLALTDAVRAAGHESFVAWNEIEEKRLSPQQFMPFVREHLLSCKLLLILYHPELRGGLIELGIAFAYGIPIWLAHHRGETVSSSALGCANRVLEYETLEDLKQMTLNMLSSSAEL